MSSPSMIKGGFADARPEETVGDLKKAGRANGLPPELSELLSNSRTAKLSPNTRKTSPEARAIRLPHTASVACA